MTGQEFIERLRAALTGRVSASLVEENVTYYNDYIHSQMRMGRSEESVTASLGDPRLIAKTIITANSSNAAGKASDAEDTVCHENFYVNKDRFSSVRSKEMPGWLLLLLVILILVIVFSALFSIISALLPFTIPILIVLFFVKLFKDWLN